MAKLKQIAQKAYPYLPVPLQNTICGAYGKREKATRFGPAFRRHLDFLTESQYWTAEQIRTYQEEKLREILRHAVGHVPYYAAYAERIGEVQTVADLELLPVLRKEALRADPAALLADNVDAGALIQYQTSGTTGKPLVFYRTPDSVAFQWAVWSRHKQRFGVRYDDYHALFTGKPIVPAAQRRPPYWRSNPPMNQLIFGMQHTRPETIAAIVAKLDAEPLRFYTGYPSIIYQVAQTALNAGLSMQRGPHVIFTGAEPLHEFQRTAIEAFFGCPVTDQYGTSEGVANASRCEHGNYHVDFEMGVIEVLPDDLGDDPATGELLMTGFTNRGMPLVRYAIGDRGKLSDHPCTCGRASRVLSKLEGRNEDYVLLPEGGKITRFDYIFKGVEGLEEAQVVQHTPGEIDLLLVTSEGFGAADERKLRAGVRTYVSPHLGVNLKRVAAIPRTASGKFRAVVNKL